jgi:hypothetical protein
MRDDFNDESVWEEKAENEEKSSLGERGRKPPDLAPFRYREKNQGAYAPRSPKPSTFRRFPRLRQLPQRLVHLGVA